MTYKTVLAPNAPWPKCEEPKPTPKPRVPKPKKAPSKQAKVDAKFADWAEKNLTKEIR